MSFGAGETLWRGPRRPVAPDVDPREPEATFQSPLLSAQPGRQLGSPLVLHVGRIDRLSASHADAEGTGTVVLQLSPSPQIVLDYESDDASALNEFFDDTAAEPTFVAIDPVVVTDSPSPAAVGGDPNYRSRNRLYEEATLEVGGGEIRQLWLHLLNLRSGSKGWHRNAVRALGSEWDLQIRRVTNIESVREHLDRSGGFEVTHVAMLSRVDGEAFTSEVATELARTVSWFLDLVAGTHVGVAVPVGVDANGTACWSRWSVSKCTRWITLPTWAGHEDVSPFESAWEPFLQSWTRSDWEPVLRSAIGIYVAANRADPVDLSPVSAAMALELLGWFVLYDQERWLDRADGREPSASARLRLLLRWAEIPVEIPDSPRLEPFKKYADNAFTGATPDGPTAVTLVRNRIIHPEPSDRNKKRPTSAVLHGAWALSCEYLELVLLRSIGYEGSYVSRFDEWAQLKPVPWIAPTEA